MNQTDVKVSFYLKKSEADARGNCPVMARLIVGKHSETAFSVKFRVPQSLWSSGRACGKSVAARDINNRLDEIRAAALGIYAEQSAIREDVTAEDVKHQLLGMASEQETLFIIRKSKFSRTPKRSVQISGFCIKRSVQKSASAQQQKKQPEKAAFFSIVKPIKTGLKRH